MASKMSVAEALGRLIVSGNPYTKAPGSAMHFVPPNHNGDGMPQPADVYISDIHIEEDSKYPSEWMFKGESQRIAKAARIQYRYPKQGQDGTWYMATDYLLIGYEGSDGGG